MNKPAKKPLGGKDLGDLMRQVSFNDQQAAKIVWEIREYIAAENIYKFLIFNGYVGPRLASFIHKSYQDNILNFVIDAIRIINEGNGHPDIQVA